uniref:CS domain-containing protein n=2 Tax=Eucampia antarctica TaxID=49252 RepID=A0A7S2WA15_9STRA|mmetsp:Transcript_24525/g.23580  ORF Transcript_24525/g.23580 Transcript_24525/m.23580 type:complete len:352 (+) Transcript_24525:65-1120(+)|eukprot:CAMPEP_0197833622 /NCGR_PEP_ID=MMETSP1437-20131217/19596_1 /TAXON_ID=49252 ORGANISM="Eucampia antarctica, Strain CCMP1452" /NCGR_SAMPLE_ID=MMETSP1437 /ASSEMBLY_ACC=CAM_ASM_001096 /LENGTH=351 /DNA_ID=CAMNT_0043437781 /DNA_START=65 /DNA_END=1120 /DNA_ORIENTATION=+
MSSLSSTSQSAKGMFRYVSIPADSSLPIKQLETSKEGGLSDDYLSKEAKDYFFKQSGGAERAAVLDNATPEEKKALAQKVRNDYSSQNNNIMSQLDDDALLNILRTSHASATCEIIALTVPTPVNNHLAVSLYGSDDARLRDMPLNYRATALMKACGHMLPTSQQNEDGKPSGVYGDVFVGRCTDDEIKDVWERVDFTVEDANADAQWCSSARKKGGGGGGGKAAAASLSSMMNQANFNMPNNNNNTTMSDQNNNNKEEGYSWEQTKEDLELKFSVASGTKAKYVKIKFQKNHIRVVVAGQVLLEGGTGGNVVVDECTYTIQDDESTGRELCVTLGKQKNEQWDYAVMKKN